MGLLAVGFSLIRRACSLRAQLTMLAKRRFAVRGPGLNKSSLVRDCLPLRTKGAAIALAIAVLEGCGGSSESLAGFIGHPRSTNLSPMWPVQAKSDERRLLSYFLDEAPADLSISNLPQTAKELVVAKVRLAGRSAWRGGRDQSGLPPSGPLPKEWLSAQLTILDVLRGKLPEKSIFGVTFGTRDNGHTYIPNPMTPSQLNRDYFVVMFPDDSGRMHLAGFPMSEAQYREWEAEMLEHERKRLESR